MCSLCCISSKRQFVPRAEACVANADTDDAVHPLGVATTHDQRGMTRY